MIDLNFLDVLDKLRQTEEYKEQGRLFYSLLDSINTDTSRNEIEERKKLVQDHSKIVKQKRIELEALADAEE